jgi:hypothetical protein
MANILVALVLAAFCTGFSLVEAGTCPGITPYAEPIDTAWVSVPPAKIKDYKHIHRNMKHYWSYLLLRSPD